MAVTLMIVGGVLAASRRDLSDLFSAFADLFSNESHQAAVARGFLCQNTGSENCSRRYVDTLFSDISIRMSGNNAEAISFSIRENRIALGDLILLWGKPEARRYCETAVFTWPARRIAAMTRTFVTEPIAYFEPILSVTFLRSGSYQVAQLLKNDALSGCGGQTQ